MSTHASHATGGRSLELCEAIGLDIQAEGGQIVIGLMGVGQSMTIPEARAVMFQIAHAIHLAQTEAVPA